MALMRTLTTVSLLALLLLFLPLSSIADEPGPSQQDGIVTGKIRYVEDARQALNIDTALQTLQQADAQPLDSMLFNLGPTQSQYWLIFSVKNTRTKTAELRLLASVAYRKLLQAYLIHPPAPPELILQDNHARSFSQRSTESRYLGSKPFQLAGGETAQLLIKYQSIGSSYLPLSIETETAFHQTLYKDSVAAAVFYSFSIAAIIVFLLFSLAMLDKTFVMYALLFSLGLLFLASMEGFAFKYLWPNAPAWNHYSPLVLQFIISGFGLLVSYAVADTRTQYRHIRQAIRITGSISFIAIPLCFVLPFVTMLHVASLFLGLMFVSQGYALATWLHLGQKRNAVAIVAGVLLALFVVMMILLSQDVSILPGYFYVYSTRVVYTLASLATMATIIAHVSGLRQDHEKTLQNELLLMQKEAETNKALYEAEQNYSRTRELAHYRQQQLASASHDMRQPLTSLRSTIDAIMHKESPQVKDQLRNAFDYLENLCSQYLRDTRPDSADSENTTETVEVTAHDEQETETVAPYSVALVLDTAARMFSDEAKHKGLQFRNRSCSLNIRQPPLVVMRLVTNLLSNAVKHTDAGRVLLGVRRRVGALEIQILDTGKGMTAEQLQHLTQAYEKGPDSSGEGLGLAICRQLAEQHGMSLQLQSSPGHGTCCNIHIPL